MSAMLTADWCPLGRDTYFRKFEIYNMAWQNELNMDNVLLAAAPYGGPVAVIRDSKKFVKVQGVTKPVISIYTASGRHLSSIVWNSGTIVALGWSASEDLLCIQDDGSVLIYDIFGTYQHTFSMGKDAKDAKIIEAKIFASSSGTGIAVLTKNYRLYLVNSVAEPKLRMLPEVSGLTSPPSSWCIISEDRQTRVLLAKDKDLFFLSPSDTSPEPVTPEVGENIKTVVEIAVSQNNRHVALFSDSGHLWIGSADLRKNYRDFNTKCPSRPKQLVWCGTEAVIGYWDNVLLLVGREGDYINYSYDSTIYLVPEMDGVRVLSAFTHEMIQKVPVVVQQIFRINSTQPGSYLLEASRQFQKQSHRADEYIRLVKDQLDVAVKHCIEAAGYEFDTEIQKSLIQVKQTQLDREQVAREIADKLGYAPGVSYSEIADKANNCGRKQLAVKLIDYEPRASLQVPLLLRLEEYRPALVKAIESGNTDLVHTVLDQLRENMPLGDFQLTIRNYPVAQALYLKYCRDHNPETLRDIYVQEDDFNAQAACFIRESYDSKNTTPEASLSAAQESYRRARNDFCASLCEEQQRLHRYQKGLEEKFMREFVGLSLHDTVHRLLSMGEVKLADKLRAEYKVPDRRYWWLRILNLSEMREWTELDKFAKSKKSPIGYEPFVDVCLQHKNVDEAKRYLPKVKDDLKVKYYVKAGLYEEASKIAFEQKDVQALLFVQSHCDRSLGDKINGLITQLGNKK
ncbi:vacuolar protein sorting-associated protein 16 homolog isoform X2 [Anabrus simplex]|uniref:vacuolar protein sorting-associated protein 16 homolog isoform X2 n=1 Tax=Anabrus simplex TaxID=316456 RepID=UPI0035A36F89